MPTCDWRAFFKPKNRHFSTFMESQVQKQGELVHCLCVLNALKPVALEAAADTGVNRAYYPESPSRDNEEPEGLNDEEYALWLQQQELAQHNAALAGS